MRISCLAPLMALVLFVALTACEHEAPKSISKAVAPVPAEGTPDSAGDVPTVVAAPPTKWDAQLLEAAKQYRSWTRVSDQARWSPLGCLAPIPGGVQVSEAPEKSPHGRKLYFIFAKNDADYLRIQYPIGMAGDINDKFPENVQQPVGQVIVKEAFEPVPASKEEADEASKGRNPRELIPPDFAMSENGLVRTGGLSELFIMLRAEKSEPGTDQGWVYATVDASNVITSVGTIESCMDCHAKAPHDRLFGVQWHYALNRKKEATQTPANPR